MADGGPIDPQRPLTLQRQAAAGEVKVETEAAKAAKRTKAVEAYVPAFPLRVLAAVVHANATLALPLVLATHRQLKMTKRESTPLNATLWERAGSPSPRKREAILRRLRLIPVVVGLEERRTANSRYRVSKGSLWDAPSTIKEAEVGEDV